MVYRVLSSILLQVVVSLSIQCCLSEGAVVHLFSRDSGAYLHLGDDGTLTAKEGTTDKRSELCVCNMLWCVGGG